MIILWIWSDLPAEMQKELRQIYVSLSEILRHFWASFPPTTPQLIEKATRMVETLQRFNQVIGLANFDLRGFVQTNNLGL